MDIMFLTKRASYNSANHFATRTESLRDFRDGLVEMQGYAKLLEARVTSACFRFLVWGPFLLSLLRLGYHRIACSTFPGKD